MRLTKASNTLMALGAASLVACSGGSDAPQRPSTLFISGDVATNSITWPHTDKTVSQTLDCTLGLLTVQGKTGLADIPVLRLHTDTRKLMRNACEGQGMKANYTGSRPEGVAIFATGHDAATNSFSFAHIDPTVKRSFDCALGMLTTQSRNGIAVTSVNDISSNARLVLRTSCDTYQLKPFF